MTIARILRAWRQRLRSIARPGAVDAELERELAFHLDQLANEGMALGAAPADPATFAGALCVLVGAAGLACVAPARRALGIEPVVALRNEG